MSLINDALKKAQKQRTGEAPSLASMPSVGGETPHRIARRAKPAGFDTLIIRAGAGAGILLVVVVGGYFVFRSDSAEQRSAISNQPSASPVQPVSPNVGSPLAGAPSPSANPQVSLPGDRPGQTPGSQQGTTASPQVSAPVPAPTFTLPVTPSPAVAVQTTEDRAARTAQTSEPPSVLRPPSSEPAKPASPAPTGSDPRVSPFSPVGKPREAPPVALAKGGTSQVAEPARPAPKLEPRAIQFIENIKVAGIMARPTDSKVLMNDRVYRVGSLVEAEMGLTLVGITANSLTFEDGNGGRYTRTF